MYKFGVYGVTPFNNKNKKELGSTKGYFKELGNATAGGVVGAATGGAIGGAVGFGFGGVLGSAVGAGAGSIIGGISGVAKSVHKGEEEAGVKKSTGGKFFGRAASTVGMGTLGAAVGGAIGARLGGAKGVGVGAIAGGILGAATGDRVARSRGRRDDKYRYLAQYR